MKRFNLSTSIIKFIKSGLGESDEELLSPAKIVGIVVALGLISLIAQGYSSEKVEEPKNTPNFSIDTFIPEGESLVPIQVSNYESLDQVIGQFGVVDLLSTPLHPGEKAKRVAFAVKLIRAPKSPRHFSVLIPAEKAHKLAGYHGQFTVVVRNPKLIGTQFVKQKKKQPKRRVVFDTESL